jgi:hypothetical protein
MNLKRIAFAGALLALPAAAFGFTRVGFGFNFGFPIYDYPPPTRVVVVQQPVATEVPPPAAPGPDYVWVSGHWEWDTSGGRWVWYGASWQRPPAPNAVWQAGYWSQQGPSWVWVHSHWAVPNNAGQPASANQPPPPAPTSAPQAAQPAGDPVQPVVVAEAPPAPVTEEIYTAPGPDFVWIGGAWVWNGAWVWAPGHYVHAPYPGAIWIGGSWGLHGHGWAWAGGHWGRR